MAVFDIIYNEILRMRDKQIDKEERVLTAKILVKKVLLGFCSDWKTYSECHTISNPESGKYHMFIVQDQRIMYHINRFTDVSVEVRAVEILPECVSDRLLELAAQMRALLIPAELMAGYDPDNPSGCVKLLDALVIDVYDMYSNFDNYCCDA